MKIETITIQKTIQEQQFEPVILSMTASVEEGEDINKATDDLRFLVSYKINEEGRNDKFVQFQDELASGVSVRGKELTEKDISQRTTWLEKYNEAAERFNNLEFIK